MDPRLSDLRCGSVPSQVSSLLFLRCNAVLTFYGAVITDYMHPTCASECSCVRQTQTSTAARRPPAPKVVSLQIVLLPPSKFQTGPTLHLPTDKAMQPYKSHSQCLLLLSRLSLITCEPVVALTNAFASSPIWHIKMEWFKIEPKTPSQYMDEGEAYGKYRTPILRLVCPC